METTKHYFIIFALVLFSTQAAIPEESQKSDTRRARCNVKIISDRNVLPLDIGDMTVIIQSPSVLGKTVREILEIAPDEIKLLDNIRVGGQSRGDKYIYTSELNIVLPDHIKPAAAEFLKALVENLQNSLNDTFNRYKMDFEIQYKEAEKNYKEAESQLNNLNEEPAIKVIPNGDYEIDYDIKRQLEKVVDLSELHESYSFVQVLDVIANSVDPPLQIQPNWRDLADLLDILPETPAEMGPLPKVKVRRAIEILLSGLSIPDTPIVYVYRDGVITIATEESLPNNSVTVVYDISGLLVSGRTSNTLIKAIKETIEPDSWYDESISAITTFTNTGYSGGYGYSGIPSQIETGEGKIVDMQGGKISIYNTPEIQEKLIDFLGHFPKEIPSEPVGNIPVNMLIEEKHDLVRKKRNLEMEAARLEARQEAAEQQIVALSDKMQNKASLDLLRRKRTIISQQLNNLKNTKTPKHPDVISVQKQLDEINKQIESTQEDTITSELERLIEKQTQQLEFLKKQWDTLVERGMAPAGQSDEIIEAEEKLARLKIELAKRREELARPIGIESLSTFNQNLSMVILDLAEKKAELEVVERQLSEIESQIKAATTTDPKVLKYRQAKKAFEEAEKRLNELKEIKANMQPPQVITIGLE